MEKKKKENTRPVNEGGQMTGTRYAKMQMLAVAKFRRNTRWIDRQIIPRRSISSNQWYIWWVHPREGEEKKKR